MRSLLALLLAAFCATGLTAPSGWAHPSTALANPQQTGRTVTATVQFRVVSSSDFRALQGARVVIISAGGRLIATGLTDADGIWRTPLTVPVDPRFRDIGTVTALVVANGHNEKVVFEVPVRSGTVQPVTLEPIQRGLRNEPSAVLGQIHRLDVIDFVTRYGNEIGLVRQPPIPGEQGYSPWGPGLTRGR